MANSITLYSISELLEKQFFIPSYQRGYRWTKQQVEDLLNDLYSFATKKEKQPKEFYCLQPIVVKNHSWERGSNGQKESITGWEVVDGQQRLTTLRILFTFLIKEHLRGETLKKEYGYDVFRLDYETREDTEGFLNDIKEGNDENIDFYHISDAYKTIREWFEKHSGQRDVREAILRTLVYNKDNQKPEGVVQVIWYQIGEKTNPISTFIRINLGKISLKNSELIKALFLQDRNFADLASTEGNNELAKLRQLEIANEWDRIENTLQDEDFWWFLNKGQNDIPARIEFIFDLITAVAKKENNLLVESIGDDRYATFRFFYKNFDKKTNFEFIKHEWAIVTDYFNIFLEWYNNSEWYHYVGFLINSGENIVDLLELYKNNNDTKQKITDAFKSKIGEKFNNVKWALDDDNQHYINFSYNKNYQQVKELLLLFNLEYIVRQSQHKTLIYKFPFKAFKEESWDLEHIDSYTDNPLTNRETQILWLQNAQSDIPEISTDTSLNSRINNFIQSAKTKENFENLQGEIVKLAGEDGTDSITKNNIGNLTLLDAGTNRAYGNALFLTKRKKIIQKDSKGTFIPICTKNVFLKYFDQSGTSTKRWSESDIKEYREVIASTLIDFLPPKPLELN